MHSRQSTGVHPGARRRAVIFLSVATIILWYPVIHALLGRPPAFLRALGFYSGPAGTPLAWILGLLVAVGYSVFSIIQIPLVREYCFAVSPVKALAMAAAIAAAIVEEAFFRRLLMDWLFRTGVPAVGQILASGLAFGIAHGIWGIAAGKIGAGLGAAAATAVLGTALAVVYLAGERSLAPVIVSHFFVTAVIQPGILYAAFSGQMSRSRTE